MTNQEKKAWLGQYILIDRQIHDLMDERDEWYACALRITSNLDGMPSGNCYDHDRLGNVVAKLGTLDDRIDQKIDMLVSLRKQIERAINGIKDPKLREILRLKYMRGKTFDQIAIAIDCEFSWATRLHGRALEAIILPKSNKNK
ncbi:MAG: DUF1492 domain-containing protein [Clostridia bacterium]|nr:DUF1492 domain-containing protein [Clostridia bacterium]